MPKMVSAALRIAHHTENGIGGLAGGSQHSQTDDVTVRHSIASSRRRGAGGEAMGATLDAWAVSRRSRVLSISRNRRNRRSGLSSFRSSAALSAGQPVRVAHRTGLVPRHQPIGLRRRAVPQLRSSLRMSMREAPPKKRTRGSRSWIRFRDMVPVNRVAQMASPPRELMIQCRQALKAQDQLNALCEVNGVELSSPRDPWGPVCVSPCCCV